MFLLARGGFVKEFLMMSYFSRICILLLAAAAVWSVVTFVQLLVTTGRRSKRAPTEPASAFLRKTHLELDGIFYLCELVSVACIADLLFAFIATYLARATDANPFPVLFQAWGVSQCIFLALLLVHGLRWYASTIFAQNIEMARAPCRDGAPASK